MNLSRILICTIYYLIMKSNDSFLAGELKSSEEFSGKWLLIFNSTSCVPQARANLQELLMYSLTGVMKQGEFSEFQGDG